MCTQTGRTDMKGRKWATLSSLEKVACGAFSDISFVSAGKKRGFCQLRSRQKCKSDWVLVAAALAILAGGDVAFAAGGEIVIGDIDDLSGTYADAPGVGGIEAIKMAIADFGG